MTTKKRKLLCLLKKRRPPREEVDRIAGREETGKDLEIDPNLAIVRNLPASPPAGGLVHQVQAEAQEVELKRKAEERADLMKENPGRSVGNSIGRENVVSLLQGRGALIYTRRRIR